jgi:hypothetical protein
VDLEECVKLAVKPSGEASLTNGCSDRLNLIYCIENPGSAKGCSKMPLGITTLVPGASEPIPSYGADGAGAIHWAVCVYPQAPVGWKPGPDSPYTCRKTCVMC